MAWKKGQSGNPGGRPKEAQEVKELARLHTEAAVRRLVFWMKSKNPKASVAACTALLDRAWGKPAQTAEIGKGMGAAVMIQIVEPCATSQPDAS